MYKVFDSREVNASCIWGRVRVTWKNLEGHPVTEGFTGAVSAAYELGLPYSKKC